MSNIAIYLCRILPFLVEVIREREEIKIGKRDKNSGKFDDSDNRL
jgi:hypothetical protein